MSKILLINGHPTPCKSLAGKSVIENFLTLCPQTKIRNLAELLRPEGFDLKAEQSALIQTDVIIWQFPFYWYSVPALMKKWIDDVLTRGFAYGSGATALHGKLLLISFTTGASETEYAHGHSMNWPIEDFLLPLLQTANLCGLETLSPVWSTNMSFIEGVHDDSDRDRIKSAAHEHALRMVRAISR